MRFSKNTTITSLKLPRVLIVYFGLLSTMTFGQSLYSTDLVESLKDSDLDGVIDARDVCNNTHKDIDVDNNGCPLTDIKYFSVNLDVQFKTGSYKLSPEFYSSLKDLAKFLQQAQDTLIIIEGHTDNIGTKSYNLALSKKRADAITEALISTFKINPNRIKTFGYGQEKPIAPNETETGRMINRRVSGEIVAPFKHIGNYTLTIPFKRNRYQIKPIHDPVIQNLLSVLKDVVLPHNEDILIVIEGHTDSSGSEKYNLALSLKRANSVADIINTQLPILKDKIKTLGYGQTFPIATNTTRDGREKNRRVNTTIVQTFKASQEEPLPRWTIWSVDQIDEAQKTKP